MLLYHHAKQTSYPQQPAIRNLLPVPHPGAVGSLRAGHAASSNYYAHAHSVAHADPFPDPDSDRHPDPTDGADHPLACASLGPAAGAH